ncbi:MAG: type II secretion system F family protein [Anaerolineae bacterium]|nr:type II secretion system F family protein [Anaerolineae bacterium]
MTQIAALVAVVAALAFGVIWIAIRIEHEQHRTVRRAELLLAGDLLAPTLELRTPFAERVLQPLVNRVLRWLGNLSPKTNLERLRRDLLIAGSPLGLTPLDFLGLCLLTALAGTTLIASLLLRSDAPLPRLLPIAAAGALLSYQLPRFLLRRRMAQRRKAMTLALPDALDMLTVCVDAGLGLESAFLRIAQSWDHALAREFHRAVMEIGVGASWREAMQNLVYRTDVPDLSSLVAVLLQADQLGFSISDTLHAQAEQLRVRRRQRAQELARAAPLKMLFPMVFFIMPATLAVILGPALPAIVETLALR